MSEEIEAQNERGEGISHNHGKKKKGPFIEETNIRKLPEETAQVQSRISMISALIGRTLKDCIL